MKKTLLLFLISVLSLISCIAEKKSTSNLRIGVISDLHYLSSQLMDGGEATQNYANLTGRNILAVPEVLDRVIEEYLQSDIEYLFIPGDLTKDGELLSHKELIAKLSPLQEKGIKIYVIPGNHDINIPRPIGFKDKSTYNTDNISPSDFEKLYFDFGYGDAFSRDTASLSYATELTNNFWLIAVDAERYDEYTTSSISSGRIKTETEQWVVNLLNEAKEKNKTVVGMMHHGLVEHIMYQDMIFGQYLVNDWKRLANLFADNGMKAIFTGHFHATDITKFTSTTNSSIYDIETGALCSYPFAYRFVSLDKNGLNIETRNIESTKNFPNLAENSKKILFSIAQNNAKQKIKDKGLSSSQKIIDSLSDLAGLIFLEHAKGDEEMNNKMKNSIELLKRELDLPIEINSNNLQLDFYPPDNNVKLQFDEK